MKRTWATVLGAVGLVAIAACFGDVNNQSDTDSPVVRVVSPRAADTVIGFVSIQVSAQDAFGVDKVVFQIDGTKIGEDAFAPYQVTWNTRAAGDGPHTIRVEATDLSGNTSAETVAVVVNNRPT